MGEPRKLIEVAMPIREISAESVRDKSIRNGHISTLHLWWARRPLPTARAVVFSSLIPDPLDENCSIEFKNAVEELIGKPVSLKKGESPLDYFKPYKDIPDTSIIDPVEDNLRNRLLSFIGKFSEQYCNNAKLGKKTNTKDSISLASLIKWEATSNERILNIARKLIWVAHDPKNNTLNSYDDYYNEILKSERDYYSQIDRHQNNSETTKLKEKLLSSIEKFQSRMPIVFDPFAGGGAIPLEAARLGCRSHGNDLNPVANLVQRGSAEFPQRFGKPIRFSKVEFNRMFDNNDLIETSLIKDNGFKSELVEVKNYLAFIFDYYSKKLIVDTGKNCQNLYPNDKDGNEAHVYYWARTAICSNPTCKSEVPLVKNPYLSQRRGASKSEWVYLKPVDTDGKINIEIKNGECDVEPWVNRGNMTCPACGNTTDVNALKEQFRKKSTGEKLIAVIERGVNGERIYRQPTQLELDSVNDQEKVDSSFQAFLPKDYTQALPICTWGFEKWEDLFSNRQKKVLNAFLESIEEIRIDIEQNHGSEISTAVLTYLGFLIDRIAMRYTTFNVWHVKQDTVEFIMGRQSISMVFDFPEMNPFSDYTSSAVNQAKQINNYILEESKGIFHSNFHNSSSGEKSQFELKSLDAVVTDPPYYDAIAYADLSDFFYMFLKRVVGPYFPNSFATPQTPKMEECTALKHHHNNNMLSAKAHFESKLLKIFEALEHQTKGIIAIMFAHQSNEAWSTLCNSILGASLNITGSWAIDTEKTAGIKHGKAFLASSVTVACRPSIKHGVGDYREVTKSIKKIIKNEVSKLYALGFRGADLLTACFGQAVSVFGMYEKVEKASGEEVTISELLDLAREAAFDAIISDISTDDTTKFYIGWLNLFGFTEADHDDVRRITQIGLTIDSRELLSSHILIRKGNKETLSGFKDRIKSNSNIGTKKGDFEIDKVHHLFYLFSRGNRNELLKYINNTAISNDSNLWRIINSLFEVLPEGCDDYQQAAGLLINKESLLRDAINYKKSTGEQVNLDFE